MPNKQIQIAFVTLLILLQLTVVSLARFVFEDVVKYDSDKLSDPNLPECIKYFIKYIYVCLFKIAFFNC
jgi:hypothetical protein